MTDNLSGKRVRINGKEGNIYKDISVGVHFDNGSMCHIKLADLEFIENDLLPKADPKDDEIIFKKR